MQIAVVGSINTDISIRVPHLPQRHETVVGRGNFELSQGGKGANQAAAAAAAGARVHMVGKVGRDDFGARAVEDLESRGIDCRYVQRTPDHSTGLATILLEPDGANAITVAPGANAALDTDDIRAAEPLFAECGIVMLQMEIPLETVLEAMRIARRCGAMVMLNPAPAPAAALSRLADVDVLTPNELEAEAMTGIPANGPDAPERIAAALLDAGVRQLVMTLGARGSLVAEAGQCVRVPAHRVDAVDTTGAGDVFSGFLAAALLRGDALQEAVAIATAAAGIAVTRAGARTNLPTLDEVNAAIYPEPSPVRG